MPFIKGQSGNRNGRPQGSKNKEDLNSLRTIAQIVRKEDRIAIVQQWRAMIAKGGSEFDKVMAWLIQLEPKQIEMGGMDGEPLQPPTIVFQSVIHNGQTDNTVLPPEASKQGIEHTEQKG
jgi:hypothetical protein